MGLLDRMLADLVGGSTGMNPRTARRMIRRIGTRNLLMMGGAAALGGLAASKAGSPGASPAVPPADPPASGSRTAVPPRSGGSGAPRPGAAAPPPPPGAAEDSAAATPPPPPVPKGPPPPPSPEESDVEAGELPPEAALPALRTMVAAALADGELSGDERSLVVRHVEEASLPEEHVRRLREDMVLPPSPAELASLAPDPKARETLYRLAVVVLRTDRQVTDAESRWLERLAAAFDIPNERRRELEKEVFGE